MPVIKSYSSPLPSTFTRAGILAALALNTDYPTTILGTSGLVGYWRLDETSGTTATDSQSGYNGTYNGGYVLGQTPIGLTPTGKAVLFNGSAGYVSVPHQAALTFTGDFSLEVWIKTTTPNDDTKIIAKYSSGSPFSGYALDIRFGVARVWVGDNSAQYVSGAAIINDGKYHHLVAVVSGSTVSIYVDADLDASATRTIALSNTSNLYFAFDGSGTYLTATLDEIALYNVALTPAQIRQHAQISKYASLPSGAGNPGYVNITTTPVPPSLTGGGGGRSRSARGWF